MGNEVTIAGASATAVEQSATAVEPGGSLRELVLAGRFFGKLTTVNAVLLFAAALLGWLPELPYVCRLGPRTRGSMRVALAAVPLVAALILANQKSEADAASPSTPGSKETTIEDYLNFGK